MSESSILKGKEVKLTINIIYMYTLYNTKKNMWSVKSKIHKTKPL